MRGYNESLWTLGVKAALVQAAELNEEPSLVGVVAERVESTTKTENYPWIGEAFAMRLLRGELETQGLSDTVYSITNDRYEIGLRIHKDHLKDDQLGAQMKRVQQMSDIALRFPNKLIVAALEAATSLSGHDGVSFFNNAHPARTAQGSALDNLLAGTGVTTAAVKADLQSAIAALQGAKTEAGEPFPGRARFVAMIPPLLMGPMNEAIFGQIVGNNSNVALRGMTIEPIVSARLTDANDWYLLDVSGSGKPLIFQEAQKVESGWLGPESEHCFKTNECIAKVGWRGAVGYGHFALAAKIVNA